MNIKEPFVINISREVGSGGHTVGSILASRLGVRYCDKFLLETLQKQFDLSAEAIENLKGKKKNWLEDFLNIVTPVPPQNALGLGSKYTHEFRVDITPDDIYTAEAEILRGFAQAGSCVIAGRSGFHVFKDHPNKLNVFIGASLPYRIDRVMKKQGITEQEAKDLIHKIDRTRENFVRRIALVSRYDLRNYDLVLLSDGHSEEQIADLIMAYIA